VLCGFETEFGADPAVVGQPGRRAAQQLLASVTAWRTIIQEFAAQHLDVPAADRTPLLMASCVQAATMSALIWWGAHGEGTPSDAVDLALGNLENGFAQR
jgi:hypothetical protein